ncbi:MAG: hypothetical protein EXR79_09165 [Myxococcales bacterium]|nr:hypothetical protein [Myxococcales bacterium]
MPYSVRPIRKPLVGPVALAVGEALAVFALWAGLFHALMRDPPIASETEFIGGGAIPNYPWLAVSGRCWEAPDLARYEPALHTLNPTGTVQQEDTPTGRVLRVTGVVRPETEVALQTFADSVRNACFALERGPETYMITLRPRWSRVTPEATQAATIAMKRRGIRVLRSDARGMVLLASDFPEASLERQVIARVLEAAGLHDPIVSPATDDDVPDDLRAERRQHVHAPQQARARGIAGMQTLVIVALGALLWLVLRRRADALARRPPTDATTEWFRATLAIAGGIAVLGIALQHLHIDVSLIRRWVPVPDAATRLGVLAWCGVLLPLVHVGVVQGFVMRRIAAVGSPWTAIVVATLLMPVCAPFALAWQVWFVLGALGGALWWTTGHVRAGIATAVAVQSLVVGIGLYGR